MLPKKLEQQLIDEAVKAAQNSYSPYSHYKVGAALLCKGGEIFSSCNSEVASYGLTDCSESSVIAQAVGRGMYKKHEREFIKAIAVVTADGGMPCGRCRQRLREHCEDCEIISGNLNGKILKVTTLKKLFPDSFGPENLRVD
jgi:cytidine deaminase